MHRFENNYELIELLCLINPLTVIPVIENGLEIEKLNLSLNDDRLQVEQRIRDTRVLLSFLHARRLGLK
jgi:hypothetical protein